MAQELNAKADSLRDAVAEIVADVLDGDPSDVNVMIQAEGFDDEREVELVGEFLGEEPASPEQEPAEEEPAAREPAAEGEAAVDADLDVEAEAAADFVEGILDILELPGDLKIRLFDDYAEVEVVDTDGGLLIGRRGATLDAIQELLRCSLQREFQRRASVKVDVEGYRAERLEQLESDAKDAIDRVLDSGDSEELEPMDVFERKAIHNLVSTYEGVGSRSQGREPSRRVVIEPED